MVDLLDEPVPMGADIKPMSVAKMGFLVDRLYEDCSPLQFLRELTRNAIEGIGALPDGAGEVRWDLDWNRHDLGHGSKVCIIDNGVGMTGPEMVHYINKLSSSIHKQHTAGNYGVGAKISAAPANPMGLVYLSWKDGAGYMIQLIRDKKSGEYGLLRWQNGEHWQQVEDTIKPDIIDQHGTMVVLLGKTNDEDTMAAPPKAAMPKKWVLRYLNQRFFRFPEGVEVKAREGWTVPRTESRHNFLRRVTGTEHWLNSNSESKGTVNLPLTGAKSHWWILSEEADTNSGHYPPGGHVAALYQDELYELVHANAGTARLQSFGIVFGCPRVVLYIEPDATSAGRVTSNTARTHLLCDNEALDWPAFATEFRQNMPDEIVDLQDTIGSLASNTDHRTAIRERLKSVRDLFRFGRYRPKSGGPERMQDTAVDSGGESGASDQTKSGSASSGGSGGRQGDIYALFAQEGGIEAEQVMGTYEPSPKWVSLEDGTRNPGQMDDRAATYLPPSNGETGILLINADFRAFTDMEDRWKLRYAALPGSAAVVREVVREWFEQQLIETIMSAYGLKQGGKWSSEEIGELWSQEALTAAVLPRYHIDLSIKRVLGQKLGKAPSAAAA